MISKIFGKKTIKNIDQHGYTLASSIRINFNK